MANIHLFRAMVVSSTAFTGAYDGITGIRCAYGLRRMRGAYGGSLIRVKRSSDNTELDIGYLADGSLDVSALTTFVGASNGLVVTFYDQSGNAYNATASGADCFIVEAGVVYTENTKPAIKVLKTTGTATTTVGFNIPLAAVQAGASNAQVQSVHRQLAGGTGTQRGGAWRISSVAGRTSHRAAGDLIEESFMTLNLLSITIGAQEYTSLRSIAATRSAAEILTFYDNNVSLGSSNLGDPSDTPTNASFPDAFNGHCVCAEFVFFNSITTSTIRGNVNTAMKAYYGIA